MTTTPVPHGLTPSIIVTQRTAQRQHRSGTFSIPVGASERDALFFQREEGDGPSDYYALVHTGNHFEAMKCTYYGPGYSPQRDTHRSVGYQFLDDYSGRGSWTHAPHEIAMAVYYPVDKRLKRKYAHGAKIIEVNAENDGWLTKFTDEGTHHDYELTLVTVADGVFQPLFRQYQYDMYTATAESAISRAKNLFVKLSIFYGSVVTELRKIARGVALGEREMQAHPAEGWIDRDLTAAIAKVKADWLASRSADAAELASAFRYLEGSLTMPSVETPWDRDSRVAAEKAAAEALSGGG